MSKDIRAFFKPLSSAKKKPVVSDDDVIPESPDIQVKTKKKESRKRRILNDSSDEDIFDAKPDLSKSKEKTKNKKLIKPVLKEVNALKIFGSSPIKRTEPVVKKNLVPPSTETGIHSDEEFDKSLVELDTSIINNSLVNIESPKKKVTLVHTESTIKEATSGNKKSPKNKDIFLKKQSPKNNDNVLKKENPKNNDDVLKKESPKNNDDVLKKQSLKNNDNVLKKQSPKNNDSVLKKESLKSKINSLNKESSKNKVTSGNKESPKKYGTLVKKENSKNKDTLIIKESPKKEVSPSNTVESGIVVGQSQTVQDVKEKIWNEKKRDFSEFIDGDVGSQQEDCDLNLTSKSKKRKVDKSLNESAITDEERYEKKRYSAVLYQNYLNRSGPKNLGTKEIPEGAPDCLKACAFLLTGVLNSFEREEVTETILKYGGTMKSGISKKVTHVLAGEEAGPAKIAKAEDLGIKIINEDEFIQMIIDLSNPKTNGKAKSRDVEKVDKKSKSEKQRRDKSVDKKAAADNVKELEEKIKKNFYSKTHKGVTKDEPVKVKIENETIERQPINNGVKQEQQNDSDNRSKSVLGANDLMWVEKYKPQNLRQIIGQHGDASNVKKLTNWLTKWYINRKEKTTKPSPWAKNDDGAYFKAALLSGPPGVGKTTTVALVCKELGFDMVEFNASDTRSKTLIKEQISELLTTSSLSGFARGDTSKMGVSKKHALVMDEVDGMAGNEDRGGLQELISLIKISAVPIICMCNDRNSQKMRSLVNYCFDLKFSKPRVDQIKSAMLSVCFKEGVKIQPDALTQIIVAANQDVRQTLNLLSMWSVNCKQMNSDQVKKDAHNAKKDLKLGPWEAVRKVFSAEEHKNMSLNDKSDLFFYDYSMAPLFVQENYLQVSPHCPKNELLKRLGIAADSISMGDLVEKKIRGDGAWSLLPLQAMYSSVIPGHALSGHVAGQIQFPGWLGKNSRRSKMQRLCQEIHAHTRLSTSGSKSSIFLDYCHHLRDAMVTPLVKDKADGIPKTLEVLQCYNLLREDLDSLTELSMWPGQRDPMVLVDSKVKAAMTRTYNKSACALPYNPAPVKRVKTRDTEDGLYEDDQEEDDKESDSDPESDVLIKKKKKQTDKAKNIDQPSTSKGKKGKNPKKS